MLSTQHGFIWRNISAVNVSLNNKFLSAVHEHQHQRELQNKTRGALGSAYTEQV
jgi:hypothetical protein